MPSTTIISTAACSDGFRAGSRSATALPAALLHLAHIPGLGAVRLNRLLQAFGSAEAVLEAGSAGLTGIVPARLAEAIVQTDTRREQEAVAAWLARGEGRDLLTLADADYPPALAELTDPPPLLYLHGRRELLQQPMLAVVGSRQATPQGRRDATRFARALAGSGLTVVSGLAAGIDAAAHEGALAAGAGPSASSAPASTAFIRQPIVIWRTGWRPKGCWSASCRWAVRRWPRIFRGATG